MHDMSPHSTESGFERLAWDSDLFGFSVARLISSEVPQALAQMRHSGVRLAYASVRYDDQEARARMDEAGALLVDRKLRFRKELETSVARPIGIASWTGRPCTPELDALAIASGHASRFRLDPRVPPETFRTLYVTWMRRSVSGEIADEVLVIEDAGIPKAVVTIAQPDSSEQTGIIGLLAVAEGSRGRGYGRRLISASEAWCMDRGASALEVVTQGRNAGACSLYTSSGFRVVADDAIYHLWIDP